jgi:(4S)-4-hydroxy-5-phosphonooxypentane-2,3-dione isomerase
MSRIALVPLFNVKPDKMDAFVERVMRQRDDCLALEPGCSYFDVLVVESRPNTVLLYEIYANAEAIALHRQMPHYKSFKSETADMVSSVEVLEWTIL